MKMRCWRCDMDSFSPTICHACLAPLEVVHERLDDEQESGGGFWITFFILAGLGLLMQLSALFL